MRILIGGFHQESNSFSPKISDAESFTILRGAALLEAHSGSINTIPSGMISALREAGAEIVPAVHYLAQSGGPVLKETIDAFLSELLDTYDANTPIDGVFLDLHGATDMVPSGDGCGYILETVRRHIGPDKVLVHAADLHGNFSNKMVQNSDGAAAFQTYPHTDYFSTGQRTVLHGLMKLRGEPFAQARVRIPMVVPAEGYSTNSGVFADLIRDAHRLVDSGEIMDFSICQMQPWLNLEDAASTVLVTAKDRDTAAKYARQLAHRLFDLRREMEIHLYSIDEVIDAAKANETDMPVILVDSADSPNAGSSADSSFMLSRLLERGETLKTCLTVADPAAAELAFAVGVGNTAEFSLGGAYEPRFQKTIQVQAYVKSLHDGIYRIFTSHNGMQYAGKTAVLQIGNIDIVVFTRMGISSDPQVYRAFGIEPAAYRLVMVKSATQYKEPYSKFSTLFYPTDTPGSSTANLRSLPFDKLPRPFYPLDDLADFDDSTTFM